MALESKDWISAFMSADRRIWREAATEVLTIGLISILPLLLAGVAKYFVAAIYTPEVYSDFLGTIGATFSNGQLLFYAIAFIATVIYYASGNTFKNNTFTLRLHYNVVSFLIGVFIALLIGIDPSLERLAIWQIAVISFLIYGVSAFMYWTITVFREIDPVDYDSALRENEDAAAANLQALRAGDDN